MPPFVFENLLNVYLLKGEADMLAVMSVTERAVWGFRSKLNVGDSSKFEVFDSYTVFVVVEDAEFFSWKMVS